MSQTRRLAAIMFTDIAGYTALMQSDEARAVAMRKRHREVFEELHAKYEGKILQYYGDGTLSVFESAIDATNCAVAIQQELQQAPRVPLRIGIHTGDIIYSNEEAIGDGVNVASRVESLATPGSVMISESVYKYIKNQQELPVQSMGTFRFKNVEEFMEIFAVEGESLSVPNPKQLTGKFTKHTLPHSRSILNRIPKPIRYVGGLILSVLLAMLIRSGIEMISSSNGNFQAGEKGKMEHANGIQPEDIKRFLMTSFQQIGNDKSQDWLALGIPIALDLEWGQDPHLFYSFLFQQDQINLPFNEYLDIAKENQLSYVLTGEYEQHDSLGYRINLTFHQATTGKKAFENEYTGEDLFALLDQISVDTKKKLGIQESYINQQKDLPIKEYFTQSLEAFRLYSIGLSDYNFGNVKLTTLLDSATRIDPSFAWAHYRLSETHYSYQIVAAKAKAHIKQAMQHRSRLPDKYDSDVRFLYYKLNDEPEKALKLLEVKQQMEPGNTNVLNDLLTEYIQQEKYDKLITLIKKQQNSYKDPCYQLEAEALALMEIGKAKNAISKIKDCSKANPKDMEMQELLALSYYRAGDMGNAKLTYEEIELLQPENRIATKMLESISFLKDSADLVNQDLFKSFEGTFQLSFANMQAHLIPRPQTLYAQLGNFGVVPIFPYTSSNFVSSQDGDMYHFHQNELGEFDRLEIKESGSFYWAYKIDKLVLACMTLIREQQYEQAIDKLNVAIKAHPNFPFLKRFLKHAQLALTQGYPNIKNKFPGIAGIYKDKEDEFHIRLKDDRLIFHSTTTPWLMAPSILFPLDDTTFIIENILGQRIRIIRKGSQVVALEYVYENGNKYRMQKQ